ncbi:hypothetical protein C7H19_23650 [Aphanothece hegewaldii CCALA 016]|uniref:Uncharacterized protein n=1 Tax=Aphanothece hegewaldii CCALA 016 TaxID=2107694 RepID=A0A2T1LR55_9CHRO|nr:hypothetical protein [Aphanothece hegewaldii]PSF30579.1 hypothetical protein C7H19_23650 [Aphanothece hegewaldii CCALA 016]
MPKQINLFHTKGYLTETTQFTAISVRQIVTGQPDDSHVIKILATNNDTIQHTFNLLMTVNAANRDLFFGLLIPANTTISLLENRNLGLLDSNGNTYLPLSSTTNLVADLKTAPTSGRRITFMCISEYF